MRRPSIQVGRPACPLPLAVGQHLRTFGEPARHREDQRHGHVGRVLGQDVRRVGDGYALACGRIHIDVVDAVREGGNQLQLRPGLLDQRRIDPVRHRRHEHVGPLDRGDQLRLAARRVIDVQLRVEELTHPGFDDIRQFAGDVDRWLFLACHCCERRPR